MKYSFRLGSLSALGVTAAMCIFMPTAVAQNPQPGSHGAEPAQTTQTAWVFKPKASPYIEPNRPVWHIADILAAHKGGADWTQPVVKDQWFSVQYISMGPGQKSPTSYQADTVIWFVVYSGEIRFTIQGHDPLVATKDFLVQVPMRTPYSMETVGETPSVRLEVRVADNSPVFPVADNPTPPTAPPGYETVKVEVHTPAPTASESAPIYLDYDKDVINNPNPPQRAGFFVRDANGFAVPIRNAATPIPPAGDVGHFHTGLAEFWYVLEGDMDVRIEGLPDLVKAHQGDLVYAPMGRYHRTIMVGSPKSTRLAMGGVTDSGAAFMPETGNNN
jgi:mannose-6-phosphate isomerase-like protein (cupin superfamily)